MSEFSQTESMQPTQPHNSMRGKEIRGYVRPTEVCSDRRSKSIEWSLAGPLHRRYSGQSRGATIRANGPVPRSDKSRPAHVKLSHVQDMG